MSTVVDLDSQGIDNVVMLAGQLLLYVALAVVAGVFPARGADRLDVLVARKGQPGSMRTS